MTCARQRRLEREAHQIARAVCLEGAEIFGWNMACADEDECTDPAACEFFKDALARVVAFDEALP